MMYALLTLAIASTSPQFVAPTALDGVWQGVVTKDFPHTTCEASFCALAGHDSEFIFANGLYRYFNSWAQVERKSPTLFAHVTEQDKYDNGAHINTYDQWMFSNDGDKLAVYILTSFWMKSFEGRVSSCACAYSVSASRVATAAQAIQWQHEHMH